MPANRIANAFGTWDFVKISGHPDLPGMETDAIEKRGVDGVAFLETHFRAEPTPIYLTGIGTNLADAQLFIANIKNLQGTQVSLYDATGTLYNGVMVRRVSHLGIQFQRLCVWYGVSFPNSYQIRWQLTVQYPYGSF